MTPVVTGLHDSVIIYAWAVDQVLRSGGDPSDGTQITRVIWNNTIRGGECGAEHSQAAVLDGIVCYIVL